MRWANYVTLLQINLILKNGEFMIEKNDIFNVC